jgi:hypothetical protein
MYNNGTSEKNIQHSLEKIKRKEDIIPLKDGVHTLKTLIDKGKLDIKGEQKNDIYFDDIFDEYFRKRLEYKEKKRRVCF